MWKLVCHCSFLLAVMAVVGCGESEADRKTREKLNERSRADAAQTAKPLYQQALLTNNISAAREAVSGNDQATLTRAVAELKKIGDPAVEALTKLAKEGKPADRRTAIVVLGELGPTAKAAIPALEAIDDSSDPDVKKAATDALAKIRAGA
jgi:HEAT repeat protein